MDTLDSTQQELERVTIRLKTDSIVSEKFKELDRRNLIEWTLDKIPLAGYYPRIDRVKKRREKILEQLRKEIPDETELGLINRLMVEHNQEKIDGARNYSRGMGIFWSASGLIGLGYYLGTYSQ